MKCQHQQGIQLQPGRIFPPVSAGPFHCLRPALCGAVGLSELRIASLSLPQSI